MATISDAAFLARQRFEAKDAGTDYTDAQYNNLRDDALSAISRAVPADIVATFAVADGTLTYSQPAGFITMRTSRVVPSVFDDPVAYPSAVPLYRLVTNDGGTLELDRDFYLYGASIVFKADPDYTGNWTLYYGGTHTLATLPDRLVPAALDYATARLYERKATEAADYFQYSMGMESVDKDSIAAKWMKLHDQRMARFDALMATIDTAEAKQGAFRWSRS